MSTLLQSIISIVTYIKVKVRVRHIPADASQGNGTTAHLAAVATGGELRIPFVNENLIARNRREDGTETVIAAVPDLITVLNAANGKAVGIGEYRYGAVVNVLGVACSPAWDESERGLQAGGVAAFELNDVEYRPLGTYKEPRSVIEEFSEPFEYVNASFYF